MLKVTCSYVDSIQERRFLKQEKVEFFLSLLSLERKLKTGIFLPFSCTWARGGKWPWKAGRTHRVWSPWRSVWSWLRSLYGGEKQLDTLVIHFSYMTCVIRVTFHLQPLHGNLQPRGESSFGRGETEEFFPGSSSGRGQDFWLQVAAWGTQVQGWIHSDNF